MKTQIVRRETKTHAVLHSNPVLNRALAARQIKSPEELDFSLSKLLPFNQLKGISLATKLLINAILNQSRILIIGDFDADGATSCAVAVTGLKALGAKFVDYLVPNRFEYGYGLTPEIVEQAAKFNPDLIITVDNGIASNAGVAAAKAKGWQVLITDHHLAPQHLPNADAIVNPNQPGDTFASKSLAGVGVIFYVLMALRASMRKQQLFDRLHINAPNLAELLDLVALGTVADLVPLDQNNRILVQQGLHRIRAGFCRPGIKALIQIAKKNPASICAEDFGFAIGPRLNAAGRLDDMSIGIACLLEPSQARANELASILDELNQERKEIQQSMAVEAQHKMLQLSRAGSIKLDAGLCLYHPDWHQGIVGLVASQIKEQYHRPTIVFADENEVNIKGSARSIPGIHIRDVLDRIATQNPTVLQKFGGHAMAAGLSIEKSQLEQFKALFSREVQQVGAEFVGHKQIISDGSLNESELDLELARQIKFDVPWGQLFPPPLFDDVFEILEQRLLADKHIRLSLRQVQGHQLYTAIAFSVDRKQWPTDKSLVKLAYRPSVNEFRGTESLQLVAEYLEPLDTVSFG